MSLLEYAKDREQSVKDRNIWKKFDVMNAKLIAKGYDKKKSWIETAKLVLKPEPLPQHAYKKKRMTADEITNSITFMFNDEDYLVLKTFFEPNNNGIVSLMKAKILVKIVRELVSK